MSDCDSINELIPIEEYDGEFQSFVEEMSPRIAVFKWKDDIANRYLDPGNVSGYLWASCGLIAEDLLITAGHAFDIRSAPISSLGWRTPRLYGKPLSPWDLARNMVVLYNYQDSLNEVDVFAVDELIEYRPAGLDLAIVKLLPKNGVRAGDKYGYLHLDQDDPKVDDSLCLIQHPQGSGGDFDGKKQVEFGIVKFIKDGYVHYDDLDTMGGASGSPLLHIQSKKVVGLHIAGGCNAYGGTNYSISIANLRKISYAIRSMIS